MGKHIMARIFLFSLLICFISCSPVPNKEEEETRNLLMDILIGQVQNQIENQINNLLGITTTKATPVLDLVGGLLGGETTTTPAPATESFLWRLLAAKGLQSFLRRKPFLKEKRG